MTPGSTTATRTLNRRISWASTSLSASSAYFDEAYGARPLKRTIQRELENPLAIKVLSGELADGSVVRADAADGELVLSTSAPATMAT